jgi:hypothetical protein
VHIHDAQAKSKIFWKKCGRRGGFSQVSAMQPSGCGGEKNYRPLTRRATTVLGGRRAEFL